jgi:putative iron-regulated protein
MHSRRALAPALFSLTLVLAACQPGQQAAAPSSQQVAEAFVSQVVLPDYQQLVEGSQRLASALDALAAKPDAAHLEAARMAWRQVRGVWEKGESWAFGPAETGGFDGNLDDWPVNEKDLRAALASGALTPELFARLTTTAKGFHGIEAVLFGDGVSAPDASELSAAQRTYLRQAGADLAANAKGLLAAWSGPSGFGSAFSANGDEAVAEILQGMVGTLEEVAAEKLGAPLKSRKKEDLESFYSDNTHADIVANLAGVREALQRSGLLGWIRSRDAQLAGSLEQALKEAQTSAQALPSGLNDTLDDSAARERIQAVISGSDRSAALLKQAAALLS